MPLKKYHVCVLYETCMHWTNMCLFEGLEEELMLGLLCCVHVGSCQVLKQKQNETVRVPVYMPNNEDVSNVFKAPG